MKAKLKLTLFTITFLLLFISCFSEHAQASNQGLLNVQKYLQCGQSWSLNQIGSCVGNNMCELGCAVTCMAMLLKTHGVNADPGNLNSYLTSQPNGYQGGCNIVWSVAGGFLGASIQHIGSPGYNLATIKSEIDENDPVIVRVLIPQEHFIVVRGYTGNGTLESDYKVYDPLVDVEKNLSQYNNKQSLRIFDNVIQGGSVSVSFKFNGTELPSPPNDEWKLWKYPPLASNFYTLGVTITNRPSGQAWDLWLYRPNGDSIDAALNVSSDILTQPFNVNISNSWFASYGIYKFKVMNRLNPRTVWAVSPPFYISVLPTLSVGSMPSTLQVGQSATFSWNITGGIQTLSQGGWTGNIQIQWHQDTIPLNAIVRPVESNPYIFIVPSSNGGIIPGSNFRLSGSNPPGSSIPQGMVFAYTNYFSISNPNLIQLTSEIIPLDFKLYDSYPNPFNPKTNINFDLPFTDYVSLKVFDAIGKEIATLINEKLNAGTYEVEFNGENISSGIYFYRLQAGDFIETRRMILLK